MEDIRFKDDKGRDINVSLMGFFKVDALEKEFIMYGVYDENDEDGSVLLGEVVRDGNIVQILGILPEEKDLVVAFYNEISNQIGDGEDE